MEEVICKIKDLKIIDNVKYFIIEEREKSIEYIVPIDKLHDKNLFINSEYKFFKQYNPKLDKYFIIQEHPYYKLNKEYDFKILRKEIEKNERNIDVPFFIVEDIDKIETRVKAFKWQLKDDWEKTTLKCQVIGYRKKGPILYNIDYSHPFYQIGEKYEFKIKGYSTYIDKNGNVKPSVTVEDIDGNLKNVTAYKWQKEGLWNFETIICEIQRFNSEGEILLLNRDNRHPFYQIGKSYEFKIVKFKTNKDIKDQNKTYKVFEILGIDDCIHETAALPGQIGNLSTNDVITCEVISIGYNIRFNQTNIQDPFFVDVNYIIQDKEMRTKYFQRALEELADPNCLEFRDKYYSKSAFWIFTFCNKILPSLLRNHLARFDYKTSIEISELIIVIEEWIITGGIISAFPQENSRQTTLKKAKEQLHNYRILTKTLHILSSPNFNDYIKNTSLEEIKDRFQELYYLLNYSNFKLIEESVFIKSLLKLFMSTTSTESDIYFLIRLDKSISKCKQIFYDNKYEKQFNLTGKIDSIFEDKENQKSYFNWTYCQFRMNEFIKNYDRSSYLAAKILRQYFYVVDNYQFRSKLLFNAYYVLNNYSNSEFKNPFLFSDGFSISFDLLPDNPNYSNNRSSAWRDIKISLSENKTIIFNITKKHYDGFEVDYNGVKGFLPVHHIADPALKFYNFPIIDYTIAASCILYSEEFNFFVLRQRDKSEPDYLSNNNLAQDVIEGIAVEGIIKSITDFGVFISTAFGDGLLHRTNISHHFWDEKSLNESFKVGDKLPVVIIKIFDEKKLELSLKALVDTDYNKYYENFLNKVEFGDFYDYELKDTIDDETSLISSKTKEYHQLEKAFCFEQYALLQNDLEKKIQYLRIAKQFFATINNARSYLINLYTDYFQILKLLSDSLDSNYAEKIQDVKIEAYRVKERINSRTIENFPDSEKLFYFLKILSLFNETSDESQEELISLLKNYSDDPVKKSLKTITKITLSNNLMISESTEGTDFSLKNIKLLRTYLTDGILSLKETQSDRLERELREKINYWRGKISEEESESQEFKSTFKTPILDDCAQRYLSSLKQKLEKTEHKDNLLREIDKINGNLASKAIMHSAFKTLAAFANTNGGALLLGVRDDKTVLGLEIDYMSLKEPDRDGFGKFFDSKIKEYFEESFSSLLEREYLKFPEGDILIVKVRPSIEPIFLLKDKEGKSTEELFVRELTSTKEISEKKELVKFIKMKSREQLRTKLEN